MQVYEWWSSLRFSH